VLALEVSRLARNNANWCRLIDLCALAGIQDVDDLDGVVALGAVQAALLGLVVDAQPNTSASLIAPV